MNIEDGIKAYYSINGYLNVVINEDRQKQLNALLYESTKFQSAFILIAIALGVPYDWQYEYMHSTMQYRIRFVNREVVSIDHNPLATLIECGKVKFKIAKNYKNS